MIYLASTILKLRSLCRIQRKLLISSFRNFKFLLDFDMTLYLLFTIYVGLEFYICLIKSGIIKLNIDVATGRAVGL